MCKRERELACRWVDFDAGYIYVYSVRSGELAWRLCVLSRECLCVCVCALGVCVYSGAMG